MLNKLRRYLDPSRYEQLAIAHVNWLHLRIQLQILDYSSPGCFLQIKRVSARCFTSRPTSFQLNSVIGKLIYIDLNGWVMDRNRRGSLDSAMPGITFNE